FRLLQEVNNLRFIDPDSHEEVKLDADQRALLLDKLATKEKMDFNAIRKELRFLDSVKFNLERGERSNLKGHLTDHHMAKAVKRWHKLDEDAKDEIVRVLLNPERDEDEARQSVIKLGLTEAEAGAALTVDLPDGYMQV